ncbi:carboxypeptidase-like regulatory domain-containing protein [Pedobacter sp. MW01-1-1]|uniref:carboxypeptidase-like regulatory domain-containing protein n=1 Tax=Pedobacter sp. MW01-1-1 TaxID=3383027 RepID=UPI003FEFB595
MAFKFTKENVFPTIFFLFFYLCIQPSKAQNILVKGLVKDASTKRPLSGATIRLEKSTLKTKTNGDGIFTIYAAPNETLLISTIGYKTAKSPLKQYKQGELLNINLTSSSTDLNEVVIADNSAATIVKKAYLKIPFNYPNKDSFYEGFFRESSIFLTPNGETLDYTIESVIDMKKGSYANPKSNDEVKLRKTQKSMTPDTGSRGRWYGGILFPIKNDVVKKGFQFLNPGHQKNYQYKLLKDTLIFNQPTYVIQFEPKNKDAYFRGRLYIQKKTYAFIKINVVLTAKGLKHYYFYLMVTPTFKNGMFNVNYSSLQDKWILNSIYHSVEIKIAGMGYYRYKTEYITTAVDTLNGASFNANKNDKMIGMERLSNKATLTDSAFWRTYKIQPLNNQSQILIDTAVKPLVSPVKVDTNALLVRAHIHKIIRNTLLQYQYERGIGEKETLFINAGVISPNWKNVYPSLELGYRNYYNIQKRAKQEKSTFNNSANYFGLILSLSTKNRLFSFNPSKEDKPNPFISLTPVFGMQRQFRKHFAFNYFIGPKFTNLTLSNTTPFKIFDFIDFGGSLAYTF